MLPNKRNVTVASFLLSLLIALHGQATTVVFIVTPQGIVAGADGKSSSVCEGNCPAISYGQSNKIFLVQRRIVVATASLQRVTRTFGQREIVPYDFAIWFPRIQEQLPANVSVTGLSEVIKNETAKTFAGFDVVLKTGTLKKATPLNRQVLVEYFIAGYENSTPLIYEVYFEIDWDRKELLGPIHKCIHPTESARVDLGLYARGSDEGIRQIGNIESDAHRFVAKTASEELRTILQRKDLSTKEAQKLLLVLLRLEAKTNPSLVGRPFTLITVPMTGTGKVVRYRK